MPLVRIDLQRGRTAEELRRIGDIVYEAMRETINVPEGDKFQIITEHAPETLNVTPSYLGVVYSPGLVLIQVTMSHGRTLEMKKALYRGIVDGLHAELGVRREDVFINLVEVVKDNWSFGNGIAHYAE